MYNIFRWRNIVVHNNLACYDFNQFIEIEIEIEVYAYSLEVYNFHGRKQSVERYHDHMRHVLLESPQEMTLFHILLCTASYSLRQLFVKATLYLVYLLQGDLHLKFCTLISYIVLLTVTTMRNKKKKGSSFGPVLDRLLCVWFVVNKKGF